MEYVSQMTTDMFHLSYTLPGFYSFMTCHWVCNQIHTTGATSGAGTAYRFLSSVCVTRSLVLCVSFVGRCLSFCTFSFGYCVVCFFFDIRIRITPLVSSNSSQPNVVGSTYGRFRTQVPQNIMTGERYRFSPLSLQCYLVFNDFYIIGLSISFYVERT